MQLIESIYDIFYVEFSKLLGKINNKYKVQMFEKLRLKKLRKISKFAFANSNFYRKVFIENGIREEDLDRIQFEQLPIIKKKDMIDNIQDVFTDKSIVKDDLFKFIHDPSSGNIYKEKYICFTTSGTLGLKLPILFSLKDFNKVIINTLFYNTFPIKFLIGKKTRVTMIGLIEGRSAGITFFKNLPNLIYNKKSISLLLPIPKIVEELNSFNPEMLISYPGVFVSLLEYKKNGKLRISPKKIVLSGEILTKENAKKIRETFNCEVVNSYGSSECLIVGTQQNDKPYLIFPNTCHIELVGHDNKPAPVGELGRIVITNFQNFSQPFIRYDIGDFAVNTVNEFGEFSFDGVAGRNYKPILFQNNEGEKFEIFHWTFYTYILYAAGIYKSQMRIGNNCFKTFLVGTQECIEKCKNNFDELLKSLGAEKSVKFSFEKVDDIKPESNGKIPFIIFDDSLNY
ncbi:AMP-binding protein [Fluviispira vulneris]|uniref:AMP-binding protein n=1 Tax=Fluviispira vulneris TaxID=2763012 RepID=UPI00164590A8|nr:AMP-binding protein [Fluviispira vulneris]